MVKRKRKERKDMISSERKYKNKINGRDGVI